MSSIVIRYDALQTVCSCSGALAKAAQSYADNLSSKVDRRFDDITGGSSDCLNNASYLVQEKIKKLSKKAKSFQEYAKKVTSFADTARRVDKEVGDAIKKNSDCFAKDNGIKTPEWKQKLISWLVDLRDKSILFDAIVTVIESIGAQVDDIMANIRHWYHCEGGKEIVQVVVAAVGLIVAIAVAIAAWPAVAGLSAAASVFAAIKAVVLFTGAVIGVVDAVSHLVASGSSLSQKLKGKFGASRVSGRINKLSDWIRIHNFGSATMNNITSLVGAGLDSIKFVSDIINIADKIKGLTPDFLKNFFRENGGLGAYMKEGIWTKTTCTDSVTGKTYETMKLLVDDKGNVKTHYTVRSVLRGLKAFVTNDSSVTNSGQGLRTMLMHNLKLDFKGYASTRFSPRAWIETKQYNHRESLTGNMFNFSDAAKRGNAWKIFLDDHRITNPSNFKNYSKDFSSMKSIIEKIDGAISGKQVSFGEKMKNFYQGKFNTGKLWKNIEKINTTYVDFRDCLPLNFNYSFPTGS